MAHEVVKILVNEDGDKQHSPKWHLVIEHSGSLMALCTSEVFGYGEGSAEYKTKEVQRGGITCLRCLGIIKKFKRLKL